jgi:uncharacterized protein (DUF2252 family)
MAASFTVAARNNGFGKADTRAVTTASVAAYRDAMVGFAQMRTLDIWYAHLAEEDILTAVRARAKGKKSAKEIKRAKKNIDKTRTHGSLQALSKLAELVDGRYRIVSKPPIVVPLRDLAATYGLAPAEVDKTIHDQFRAYRQSLQDDRRHLLERFQLVDIARKVVGVGSVGTRCYILLLVGRDNRDPLFLQVKEAQPSVLQAHLARGRYANQGRRVVEGQRLMQAASDVLLGWIRTPGIDGLERDFYVRQLWDWKYSVALDEFGAEEFEAYARLCGRTLARAHARTGDRVAIAAYLGKGDSFDDALGRFSESYAETNEDDHRALVEAIRSGRVKAEADV